MTSGLPKTCSNRGAFAGTPATIWSRGTVGLNDWMRSNEHARRDGAAKQALKPAKEAAQRGWLAAGPGRITSRGTDFSNEDRP